LQFRSPSLLRFCILGLSLPFFLTGLASAQTEKEEAPPKPQTEHVRPRQRLTPETLPQFLEEVRVSYGLPALGAAVVFNNKASVVTVGVRKMGDPTPVTNADGWHLGSCTKSMTATLTAMFVEEGRLSWHSTLSTMLPEIAEKMQPEYRDVTLSQLLSHRSGLSRIARGISYESLKKQTEPLPEQRIAYVKAALAQPPAYPPGTKMVYSNLGYVVVGTILERLTGESWEDLIRKRLFEPLGMKSVTFGTRTSGAALEPWPHAEQNGQAVPKNEGLVMELPLVFGPAGTVRCSLEDWSKYALFWLQGLQGRSDLLKPESFRYLTTAPDAMTDKEQSRGDEYASGWRPGSRAWSAGKVFTHSGTNSMNYSTIWLAPHENFAVLIVTNRGEAAQALDDVAGGLITEMSRLSRAQ
jgi:CubicO group peptidase (beta-lactamase class C family)